MNFFRKRKSNARVHPVPVPAPPVIDSPVDILPETIDQGLHRFVTTTETGNAEKMYEAVLFLNESLVNGARRARHRCAVEEAANKRGVPPPRPLPIAPMAEQWLAALDTLSAAALPIALRSLQNLFRGSTKQNWNTTMQNCATALANLIFFVLVAYRRLDIASSPSPTRGTVVGASAAAAAFGVSDRTGLDMSVGPSSRAQIRANDKTQRQLRAIGENIKASLSEYLSLLVWNAEEQIRKVTDLRIVSIKGHPDFHDLPAVASYLSPHDCFIWLLVASVLHGVQIKAPGTPPVSAPVGGAANQRAAPPASDTPASSSVTGEPPPPPDSGSPHHSHHIHNHSGGGASGPDSHDGVLPSSAGNEPTQVPLGWVAQTLLTWNADGDGALFTQLFVEVILKCLNIYFKAWLERRTHVFQLVDAWSVRDVVFPASAMHVEPLIRELTASDPPATEDISYMIQMVSELVVHASFVFYGNPRCLVQLLYLLGPLNTVRFLCVISAVETLQAAGVTSRGGGPVPGSAGTPPIAEVWRSGVSRLMESFAEYVLEPCTSNGADVPDTLVVAPPPEVSTLLLQLTIMHIAAESCTHSLVEVSRSSATPLYTAGMAATRRQQLRTWSTWISAARATLFRQCTPTGDVAAVPHNELDRLDALFAQMLCLAFEDLYSFVMVIHRREVGALLDLRYRRVLFTAFTRIKAFMTRLHEEHAQEVGKGSGAITTAGPAMRDGSFHAVNEVLDQYVSALRVNAAAPSTNHRSHWLLAVSYLRLSGLQLAGEAPLGVSLNYSCSTPGGSIRYLRDRSYECYEDWVVHHQGKSWVQDEHACNLERYSHEFQPSDFVAHERLLYCAMRFLCVAVKAAREEELQVRAAAAAAGSHHAFSSGDSQAEIYLTAFTRFLLMMDTLSCSSLCAFLRQAHRMLMVRDDVDGAAVASVVRSATNPIDSDARTGLIDSVAVHQATLFSIDNALFFL